MKRGNCKAVELTTYNTGPLSMTYADDTSVLINDQGLELL